ncbi:hypothetical protein [Dysgonomonas sp. 25]|uniref:hypothetical protein n=1 Tax=Dysgonomonas sp. 25 TaxID=2302933 RepID=UPI0013D53BC4|nr:hypothetical protein [Dysgonomonas sp. 25]NDV69410.1 hypothetical protein [Dysgonomonas sp. 25]
MKLTLSRVILTLLFIYSTTTIAQVTIGSDNKPNPGALLDLKQKQDGTSDKGMSLPRVSLTDANNLFPMFETSPGSGIANSSYTGTLKDTEDENHTGLIVYNTNEAVVDFCKGLYLWTGTEWVRIPSPCAKARFTPENLLFYKSALAAKNITLEMNYDGATVQWANDGVIPLADWQQYPSNLTRDISKIFTFQPDVNNTGGDRTAVVTATVKIRDRTFVYPITITQLDREMTYSLNKTSFSPYAATHSVIATTEASDWSAAISSTNPGTMITALANNTNRTSGKTMSITLDNNNTWAERIAKLDITSTDPHFKNRDIEVKQLAAAPSLIRVGSGAINLTSAQNVTLNTNAQWKYEVQSGNYNDVVGSASLNGTTIMPGTTQGTSTPVITNGVALTLNPATTEPVPGTYTTTLRFSALNTSPQAAPAPLDVTVNRTVAARFAFNSLSATSVARTGGNVTVNVSTNAAWKATPSIGTASANQNPSYFGNKSTTINIPANTDWSLSTTPVKRTITVSAVYGNNTSSMSTSGGSKKITQPGYYISGKSTDLNSLPANTSTNVSVSLTGAYPTMNIRAYQIVGRTALATGTIAGGESGTRSVTLSVPANATWNSRSIRMEYYHPGVSNGSGGFGAWKTVGSAVNQAGYTLTGSNNYIPVTIPSTGGNYKINTSTTTWTPNFRVKTTADGVGDLWISAAGGVGQRTVTIPGAGDTDRTIKVYIAKEHKNGTNNPEWVQVYTGTQEGLMVRAGNIYIDRNTYGPAKRNEAKAACESRGARLPYRSDISNITNRTALQALGESFFGSFFQPFLTIELDIRNDTFYYCWSTIVYGGFSSEWDLSATYKCVKDAP